MCVQNNRQNYIVIFVDSRLDDARFQTEWSETFPDIISLNKYPICTMPTVV